MLDGSPEAGVGPTDPATTDDQAPGASRRRDTIWFIAIVVVTALPVVVAVVRALNHGWVPLGDDAFFAIRPLDVFSNQHRPLLGTWSSASLSIGQDINNPGPLFFDVLALPTKLLGGYDGPAVGTALLNVASIVGIGLVARRRGGLLAASAALLMTAALCWSMGSELIFDPWQPHSMVLPFLCFLMLVWSMSCGDLLALPWAIALASLLFQTHLSYAYLVPVLSVWGLVALIVTRRRRRAAEPDPPGAKRQTRWVVGISVVVAVAGWVQPLWEELTSGDGNISRLVDSVGQRADTVVGYTRGARLLITVLALPPWWLRPSFSDAFAPAAGGPAAGPGKIGVAELPALAITLVLLGVIALVLGLCIWLARRAADSDAVRALVTTAIGIVVGLYTAAQIPRTVLGVAPHQFRYVWPLSAFMTFAVVVTVARVLANRAGAPSTRALTIGLSAATLVLALLTLPTTPAEAGPSLKRWAMPVVRRLDPQLGGLHRDGPLLYDFRGVQYNEPYSTAIMAELQRRGVPFVVSDGSLIHQLGNARRYDGHNARSRIFYRLGDDSLVTPPGGRRVALTRGLAPAERRELDRLVARLEADLDAGRLQPTAAGRDAIEHSERYPALKRALDGSGDAETVLRFRELVLALHEDILVLDPAARARLERYVELQGTWDQERVAVFVVPITARNG